jgi:DNA-binding NarL/FixJ family response regulator
MESTRILIVNNHTLFWEGLKGILEAEADLQVTGEARNVKDAITLAARHALILPS